MGLATTCFMTVRRPKDTLEFLEYCRSLGAGGIQAPLTSMEPAYLRRLRETAEKAGMYIETMAPLPKKGDASALDRALGAAKEVGALCARIGCLSGRRYETFTSMEQWQTFVGDSKESIRLALRVAERHKFKLALENHKDWTVDEHVALMQEFQSEYMGVLLDTGNNISLLDDPYEVVEKLAPFAYSTHIKDMGLAEYKDGFLLSEMPLKAGCLDLKRIVEMIHKAQPKTKITLEMITRNPLEVPALTDKYWVTFNEGRGRRLAATLRMAKDHGRKLPRMDGLPPASQAQWEEDNVKQCLNGAREQLGI